ncbi:MAG: UDP-3-O-(3-hydroxymyristoyl)glucosamine N-acyltransferase [Armatimonadetes bacterium]|nr:UDP-3-O-(3-hydroxymyristoyl)glucosamine N-acyltransferase [Armatimonadota bacterium]
MKEQRPRTAAEIAEVVQGNLYGDPATVICGIASIEEARSGDITFAESTRFLETAQRSMASAILAPLSAVSSGDSKVVIGVENPRLAFVQLLDLFAPEVYATRGVHPTAVIGSDLQHGELVSIGAQSVIGENVKLGKNVTIHPLCYIGDNVEIGNDTVIFPHVTLLHGTRIGSRTIIHSGTVIGADGFGYMMVGGQHRKVPQIGTVLIGDDVEIGANCTIDRAKTGVTSIGEGSKLDNLVHIAHNCQIGKHCLIVAQVGLAGGVHVGDYSVFAGQSGAVEQAHIGARSVVAGRGVVVGNLPEGSFVSGFPARPHKEMMRQQAAQARVPDLLKKMRELEKRLGELEKERPSA